MNYNRILAAIDLSTRSDCVLKCAHKIAEKNAAVLYVVHVQALSPASFGGEFSLLIDPEFQLSITQKATQQIKKFSAPYAIASDHQYLKEGSIKHAVTHLAAELNVDLLVVGGHSKEESYTLIGSQANAILHIAKCDVLVAK